MIGCCQCGEPAVILIVVIDPDDPGTITSTHGVCDTHAPEEAHEARASMDPTEFTIVDLNAAAAWRDTAQQALRAHAETAGELLTANAWAHNLITGE